MIAPPGAFDPHLCEWPPGKAIVANARRTTGVENLGSPAAGEHAARDMKLGSEVTDGQELGVRRSGLAQPDDQDTAGEGKHPAERRYCHQDG
jgi:hypothetical protein